MAFPKTIVSTINRWEAGGLIDQETAKRLLADVALHRNRFGLGGVLAVLGALLLGAAILTLVAANWETIPRLVRVVLMLATLWVAYLGGAWRQSKGDDAFASALYLIGAATFGAGIALIGQMYHLSGDAVDAALFWAIGVMVSAAILRSPVLAAAGVALGGFYMVTALDEVGRNAELYRWIVPLLVLLGWGLAVYTTSRLTRHLTALLLVSYIFVLLFDYDLFHSFWVAVIPGFALFLADVLAREKLEAFTGFAKPLGAYGFAMAAIGLMAMQFEDLFQYENVSPVLYAVLLLGLSIGGLLLAGRQNIGVRWLAYATFAVEVIYIAFETVGTLIGTAGFFLTIGILVLLIAAFVVRMERRLDRKNAGEGAGA
ncbi:MAG: DUF2157 domain-containing protein [Phyllobacterium sp.]